MYELSPPSSPSSLPLLDKAATARCPDSPDKYLGLQKKYAGLQKRYKERVCSLKNVDAVQRARADEYHLLSNQHTILQEEHKQLVTRYAELRDSTHSENSSLKQAILNLRKLNDHSTKVAAHFYGYDVASIHGDFSWVDNKIGTACLSLGKPHSPDAANGVSTSTISLHSLLHRIMGVSEQNMIKNSVGGRDISELEMLGIFAERRQLGRQDILRSLVSAYSKY